MDNLLNLKLAVKLVSHIVWPFSSSSQSPIDVTFSQPSCTEAVFIQIDIVGLTPGKHGFHVHEKWVLLLLAPFNLSLISFCLQRRLIRRMYVSIRPWAANFECRSNSNFNGIKLYCSQQEHRRPLQSRQIETWSSWGFRSSRRWLGQCRRRRQWRRVNVVLRHGHHPVRRS